jgi:hypothetical protein
VCFWVVSTIKDPLGEAKEQTWKAAPELQWKRSEVELEPRSDPLVLFASSLIEVPVGATPTIQAAVYVPAYSHIRAGSGRGRVELATTLSIQNSSRSDTSIVLKSVTYHNTEGELVRSYLGRVAALRPLGTMEVFVPEDDLRGGSGANFIVHWASASPVTEPVIEAVMIGVVGTTGYSFVSQGRSLRTVVN